jgi:CheY-like chemotaxis protein
VVHSCRVILAEPDQRLSHTIGSLIIYSFPHIQVTLVPDGAEALAAHAVAPADLIIAAGRMPHMDGVDLIEQIRGLFDPTPIILYSNCKLEPIALAAGATRFVDTSDLVFGLAAAIEALLPLAWPARYLLERAVGRARDELR